MTDRLAANLALLGDAVPATLAERLRGSRPQACRLVPASGASGMNITKDGALLFQPDAETHARQQVQGYLANPVRHFSRLTHVTDRPVLHADRVISEAFRPFRGSVIFQNPDMDGGALVSFGIGLGLHLEELVDRLPFRDLILVEADWEFLHLSLTTFDWAPVLRKLTARGGRVHLVLETEPQAAANMVMHHLRGAQFPMLDGSFIFQLYNSPGLDALVRGFAEIVPLLGASLGYFEDECLILYNSLKNLRHPHRVLRDGLVDTARDCPVFIVGSGPSLDGAIEHIRTHRDKAVIFSGGTATSALLRNGIRPDFHCEIENYGAIYDGVRQLAEQYDLRGITLIAPYAVDPRIPPCFDSSVFFHREGVAASRLLSSHEELFQLSGPSVTNLAARAAASLGFADFYLFGMDLGARDASRHHSDSSIYATSDDPFWQKGGGIEGFDIRVEGNFGGAVYTNRPFLLCRSFFRQLFTLYGDCGFANCSDGVAIPGSRPLAPADISLPAGTSQAELDHIHALLPATSLNETALKEHLKMLEEDYSDLCDRLAGTLEEPATGVQALIDMMRFALPEGEADMEHGAAPAARGLMGGSLITMLQFAHFLFRRLGAEDRAHFLPHFMTVLRRDLDDMRMSALGIIQETAPQPDYDPALAEGGKD